MIGLLKRLQELEDAVEILKKKDQMKNLRLEWLRRRAGLPCTHEPPFLMTWFDENKRLNYECSNCGRKCTKTNWDLHIPW